MLLLALACTPTDTGKSDTDATSTDTDADTGDACAEQVWHPDADLDGYGDPSTTLKDCEQPDGYVADGTDCKDTDPATNPAAIEACDEIDNDCDGATDEDLTTAYYADADADGYGDPASQVNKCAMPDGYTTDNTDCNDATDRAKPGETEVCDEIDNDCDTLTDEDVEQTFYVDYDADGHGTSALTELACATPAGFSPFDDDCDDTNAEVFLGAEEEDDDVDNDCDDAVDEGLPSTDDDGDGFADDEGDCDDADDTIHPSAEELDDDLDNDCDGFVDEGLPSTDDDGDGFAEDDCDDADDTVFPGAEELDDALDNDCDGAVDEGLATTDDDGDGVSEDDGDCDDADDTVHPTATETLNGVDDDCDGTTDEGTTGYDDDADGYTEDGGDCDDAEPAMNPGETEADDDLDNDCDGEVDEGYAASDDDGDGVSEDDGDCDDADDTVFPGSHATEVPLDGIDQDCDGNDGCTDLDCDGYADIVLPNGYDDGDYTIDSYVYHGPDYAERTELPTSFAYEAHVEDFDGDGYQDIAFANAFDGASSYAVDSVVYWGSASGHSATDRTDLSTFGARWICSDDLDENGYPDLVFVHGSSSSYTGSLTYVYFGSSLGFSDTDYTTLFTAQAYDCSTADLDDDGFPELILPNGSDGDYSTTSYIFWGSGGGPSDADRTDLATNGPLDHAVADLDGDDALDVVMPSFWDGDVNTDSFIYRGSDFSDRDELATIGPYCVVAEDFDGDGEIDLAFGAHDNGSSYSTTSYVYYGPDYGERDELATAGVIDCLAEDLDGDGYKELVMATHYQDSGPNTTSYIFWGSAAGFSDSDMTGLATHGAYGVSAADLDGDGYLEVLFANAYDGATSEVESYIYWGSASGYSESDRTGIEGAGSYTRPVVVGG